MQSAKRIKGCNNHNYANTQVTDTPTGLATPPITSEVSIALQHENRAKAVSTQLQCSSITVSMFINFTGLSTHIGQEETGLLSKTLNPLLGAAWPIIYFLQGRLGMAASFTRTYRFVCLAIVAKHLWCEQPVKEIQLTSICYIQICVYSSSYGDFLRWINRRPAAFTDSTRSDRDIFVRITIALIYSSPMNGHC